MDKTHCTTLLRCLLGLWFSYRLGAELLRALLDGPNCLPFVLDTLFSLPLKLSFSPAVVR